MRRAPFLFLRTFPCVLHAFDVSSAPRINLSPAFPVTASRLTLVTRGSPLARRQTELTVERLSRFLPDTQFLTEILVTTGDRRTEWSLEKQGGKGLFTSELEAALREGRGDIAVHSAKDLPTDMPEGLAVAGYLPREDAADVLVRRIDRPSPALIATGSPRRRTQASLLFPKAAFCELRGNVDTRLRKIAAGEADASFLAAAGLNRLGIREWPGLVFERFDLDRMVPAAGQAAVAIQVREQDVARFSPLLDADCARAVGIERRFLARLGEGCHTAFAAHWEGGRIHLFRDDFGRHTFDFEPESTGEALDAEVDRVLKRLLPA